jgi:predicted DNA-binding transcriptional regulator AlpA
MLALSPRLLWTLTNTGEMPCVRIGRTVRYDPAELRAWVEAHKTRGRRSA